MPEFIRVASVDDIKEGQKKGFDVNGERIMLAKINGKIYAMNAVCSHKHGPLDEGDLNFPIVTCPWHGARFDITTGHVVRGPAVEPQETYPVEIRRNNVFVKI